MSEHKTLRSGSIYRKNPIQITAISSITSIAALITSLIFQMAISGTLWLTLKGRTGCFVIMR